MNRKSVYSLVLAAALAVFLAFPVFADDLATASDAVYPDADYYTDQLLSFNVLNLSATNVGYTFSAYSDGYLVSSGSSAPAWSKDLLLRFTSTGTYFECGSGLHVNLKLSDPWSVKSCQLQIRYTSGATKYINVKYDDIFTKLSGGWAQLHLPVMFEGEVNQIGILISGTGGSTLLSSASVQTDIAPSGISLSGLYKGTNNVLLARVHFPFGIAGVGVIPYHDIYPFYSSVTDHMEISLTGSPVDGVYFERGFEYYVSFKANIDMNRVAFRYNDVVYKVTDFTQDSDLLSFTFESPARMNASDVSFLLYPESVAQFYPVCFIDVGSNYVPSDQSGSVSAGNTTIIKNVVTNISNTVSNISNQITTSTTTITNAVNNVANQVTGSINSQTNTLSDKIQGQTNTITNNQNQNTDKVIQNQKENTDKVIKNQDENTDKVVKNQDENTTKVTEKLEDVKTGIINGIIEGLKNLFIPSDDFFKSYFDDLYSWFGERLGFLSFPIDLLAELAEMFLGSSSTDCILTLPSFSISGFMLWEESTFNLTSFLNENFKFVLDAIKLGTSVILVFNFIHLCERKWEEVMMN